MTEAPPSQRILVHTSRQSIRWGDMDAFGHVNNTVYFRYMEQARIEWLYALAKGAGGYEAAAGPVIVNAQLRLPGRRSCTRATSRCACSSATRAAPAWAATTRSTRDGRKFADGASRIVWIDIAYGRPVPLPAAVTAVARLAK